MSAEVQRAPSTDAGVEDGANDGANDGAEAAAGAAAIPGAANTADMRQRRIRSFVTRAGRISVAQQRSLDELAPRFGIPYTGQPLDLAAAFGQASGPARPVVLEVGFGMGETTAHMAAARPDVNFLGIEVHTPGVGALYKQIGERGLTNLRIIQHDAVEVLEHMIVPAALAGVHIYFPDPWHKARHHKRRLIQPPLVRLLVSRLANGGYLHCATDWEDYAVQMLEVLSAEAELVNTAGSGYSGRSNPLVERPATKFEQRGLRLGHGVWDLIFTRRAG